MNQKVVAVIAVVVVLIGGWYLLQGSPAAAPATETGTPSGMTAANTPTGAEPSAEGPKGVVVTYTDQGFSPKSVSLAVGGTVTFVNQSSKKMWVASAMHPTHTTYSGTSLSQHCPDTNNDAFDECKGDAPGSSFSFTFDKVGTWNYHDHITSSNFGSVTVTSAQ